MAYLTHCCCGCMTVKTGTKVLAILALIGSVLAVIGVSVIAANFDKIVRQNPDTPPEFQGLLNAYYGILVAYAVFFSINLIVAALCLHGANTDQHRFLLPYLVYDAVQMVIKAIITVFLLVLIIASGATGAVLLICSLIISMALQIYFFVVVLSFYKQLSAGNHV